MPTIDFPIVTRFTIAGREYKLTTKRSIVGGEYTTILTPPDGHEITVARRMDSNYGAIERAKEVHDGFVTMARGLALAIAFEVVPTVEQPIESKSYYGDTYKRYADRVVVESKSGNTYIIKPDSAGIVASNDLSGIHRGTSRHLTFCKSQGWFPGKLYV